MEVIYRKTGKLFEAGTQIGAILADQTRAVEDALRRVRQARRASPSSSSTTRWTTRRARGELGKNIGDDLAEGKPTLPLIYALQRGSPREQVMIRRAIEHGGLEELDAILRSHPDHRRPRLHAARARELRRAGPVAALARCRIPPSRTPWSELADFAVDRRLVSWTPLDAPPPSHNAARARRPDPGARSLRTRGV